jgi:hypothetical protein
MQTASFRAAFAATDLIKRKTAFGFTGPEPARLGRPDLRLKLPFIHRNRFE